MYDTEMKLNHQILQFLEFQVQALLPSSEERKETSSVTDENQDSPEVIIPEMMLSLLVQYLSGLKAINCLLNRGYVSQTRGIFQTLGDDYEDIIFLSLPSQEGIVSPLHQSYLNNSADDSCSNPVNRREIRNMIRRAKKINQNVFQLHSNQQVFQVLRTQGAKHSSVDVAIDLHRHFAYKAILLAVLTAKVSDKMEVMRACLNYRAHLEMIAPNAVEFKMPEPRRHQPITAAPRVAAITP